MDQKSQKVPSGDGKQLEEQNGSTDFNFLYFKQTLNVRAYRKEIQKKMEELNDKRLKIYQKVVYYEKKTEEEFRDYIRGEAPERKKRNRRTAQEITRQFDCPTCGKNYGSEGSLHQHIKLKHPNVYEPKKKNSRNEGSYDSDYHEES